MAPSPRPKNSSSLSYSLACAGCLPGKVPFGFPDAETFARAEEELKTALKESGLDYKAIGVRGSSVTGLSSNGAVSGLPRRMALRQVMWIPLSIYLRRLT